MIIIIIIIIVNTYVVQINIQEDMIKCALHIKIESKITIMLRIYNFEFTICILYKTLKRNHNYKLNLCLK